MFLMFLAACGRPPPQVVVAEPDGTLQPVDPAMAEPVGQALNDLATMEPEAATAADVAAKQDPAKLLGTWTIHHTISRTNGEASEPSEPLMPTSWEFGADGTFHVRGGMAIDAAYLFTGDRLVVTGFGPKQDYRIDRLTDDALEVTGVIEVGTLKLENTTVLAKAPH